MDEENKYASKNNFNEGKELREFLEARKAYYDEFKDKEKNIREEYREISPEYEMKVIQLKKDIKLLIPNELLNKKALSSKTNNF